MLCDPVNVLTNIKKNRIYEIYQYDNTQGKIIKKEKKEKWFHFLFNYYFPLAFYMARFANFKPIKVGWKDTIIFDDSINEQAAREYVRKGKVLVSVFKGPDWLNPPNIKGERKNDFLFIMYNPNAPDGKKATLSYHKAKTLNQVRDAEFEYKPIMTRKMIVGISLTILMIVFQLTSFFKFTILSLPVVNFLVIIFSIYLMYNDIENLIKSILGNNMGAIITKYKKSMSGRFNSNLAFPELEKISRMKNALIAKYIILYIISNKVKRSNLSILKFYIKNKIGNIEQKEIDYVLKTMIDKELIYVDTEGILGTEISKELILNVPVFDERLYEEFDLPDFIQEFLYKTYKYYINILNEIQSVFITKPIKLTDCEKKHVFESAKI